MKNKLNKKKRRLFLLLFIVQKNVYVYSIQEMSTDEVIYEIE